MNRRQKKKFVKKGFCKTYKGYEFKIAASVGTASKALKYYPDPIPYHHAGVRITWYKGCVYSVTRQNLNETDINIMNVWLWHVNRYGYEIYFNNRNIVTVVPKVSH